MRQDPISGSTREVVPKQYHGLTSKRVEDGVTALLAAFDNFTDALGACLGKDRIRRTDIQSRYPIQEEQEDFVGDEDDGDGDIYSK